MFEEGRRIYFIDPLTKPQFKSTLILIPEKTNWTLISC